LRVTSTWQFEAGAGAKKQVFVPVTVSVATIRVMAGERVVKTTRKVVAAEATPAKQPGLTLLPADSRWSAGAVVDEYPLAGDTSGAPADFSTSYAKERSDRVDLGGKAFGAEVKLSADVTIAETITLSLKLTGGHDYVLRRFKTGQGMLWHVR
jgi:hypothetical protein